MNTGFRLIFLGLLLACSGMSAELKAQEREAKIEDHIHTYLTSRYSEPSLRLKADVKWVPSSIKNDPSVEIVSVKYTGRNKIPRGYEPFQVTIKDSLTGSRTDRMQVFVAVEQYLPVASRRIQRGDSIDGENAHLAWFDVTRGNQNWITSLESVEGQVAESIINAGNPFTLSNIGSMPVVFAGDTINLLYSPGGLQVQLTCVARQDGAVGERIRLYSQETGKIYLGEVINNSTVKWKSTL